MIYIFVSSIDYHLKSRNDNFALLCLIAPLRFTSCEFSPSHKGDGAGAGMELDFSPAPWGGAEMDLDFLDSTCPSPFLHW